MLRALNMKNAARICEMCLTGTTAFEYYAIMKTKQRKPLFLQNFLPNKQNIKLFSLSYY